MTTEEMVVLCTAWEISTRSSMSLLEYKGDLLVTWSRQWVCELYTIWDNLHQQHRVWEVLPSTWYRVPCHPQDGDILHLHNVVWQVLLKRYTYINIMWFDKCYYTVDHSSPCSTLHHRVFILYWWSSRTGSIVLGPYCLQLHMWSN